MITTHVELLEKLLTDDCKAVLAVVDKVINETTLDDLEFNGNDQIIVYTGITLSNREDELIKAVLSLAGWENVDIHLDRVAFYL